MLIFGVVTAGGIGEVIDNAKEIPGYLSMVTTYSVKEGASAPYGVLKVASMLAWGLGYFGMPHVLLRFMTIREESHLKRSRRIAIVWVLISMTAALAIGVVGASVLGVVDSAALIGAEQ